MTIDLALLGLRVLIGLVVAAHGAQKLFGWWGGSGIGGFSGWLSSMGLQPARSWAVLGGLSEFAGGLLLALGLLTPIGALGIVGAMAMAIVLVHWSKGFWGTNGGYEFPLVLLLTSAIVALAGPGAYSLDALLSIALPAWLFWAGLVGVALVVAYAVSLTRRGALTQKTAA